MSTREHETASEVYARAMLDAAAFVRGGMVGLRCGEPGELMSSAMVTEICMHAFKAIGDVLTDKAVNLGAANAPPPPGTNAAAEQGCKCVPQPWCPIHGLDSPVSGREG